MFCFLGGGGKRNCKLRLDRRLVGDPVQKLVSAEMALITFSFQRALTGKEDKDFEKAGGANTSLLETELVHFYLSSCAVPPNGDVRHTLFSAGGSKPGCKRCLQRFLPRQGRNLRMSWEFCRPRNAFSCLPLSHLALSDLLWLVTALQKSGDVLPSTCYLFLAGRD